MSVPARRGGTQPDGLLPLLLGDLPPDRFLAEHYLQAPCARPGTAAALIGTLTPQQLAALVEGSACDLTAVRDGRVAAGPRPGTWREARALHDAGWSLVFRHAERHDPELAALAGRLARDLHGTMDAHIYLTPAGRHGFGWHYDAEEVFFIQIAGAKDFYLRANTLVTDPVPETVPADMGFARETSPVLECRLLAGDWLYIPSPWWHMAVAREDSASISLGLLAPTPLELLDALRRTLVESPAWRRRLPPLGAVAAGDATTVRNALAAIPGALGQAIAAPAVVEGWLAGRRSYAEALLAAGAISRAG